MLFPWVFIESVERLPFVAFSGLLGQWAILGMLNWQRFRSLKGIGASTSKKRLTPTVALD